MFFDKFKKDKPKVSITSINLKFLGDVHNISGKDVSNGVFELEVPFQNRLANDLLPDNLKGPSIRIGKIEIAKPFELVSVTPAPPVEIPYMTKTIFSFKIKTPNQPYSGPMTIDFGKEIKDEINLGIEKIVLEGHGRSVELEDSGKAMRVQKGQVFRKDIQLYKVLSYQDKIERIEVNKPFELMNTEPKVPFTIENKDSYIMALFFKVPDFGYAGKMTITFVTSK